MRSFTYVIADKVGIHARPAGVVVKTAQKYQSSITIGRGDDQADMKKLMEVMSLGVKCGQEITVTAVGTDEEAACTELETIFKERL